MNITKNIFKKNIAINKIKDQKIREINLEDSNKKCFDCQNINPQYISLYNGIFICERCVNHIHKRLPSNISLILDNNLQNLFMKDIQYLYYGGNKKLFDFINYEYPILKTLSKNKIYQTKAMKYYREWLKYLIYAGDKPIKPALEESIELIGNNNKKEKKDNKYNEKIINIDFLNNCYNYENDHKLKQIIPTNYNNNTDRKDFNYINYTQSFDNGKEMNRLSLNDNKNKIYNSDNEENYDKEIYYKEINKTTINKFINWENINTNLINNNKNKLITKKLSLKKHFKNNTNINKDKNTNNESYLINITKKGNMNKINNNNIYIKPRHSLLHSFQKNALSRNNKIEKEEASNIKNSLYVPVGNNYQTILINNNIYDNLLMYNFDDSRNRTADNIKKKDINVLTSQTITNNKKYLNFSSNYENLDDTIQTINNNNNNNDIVFKKKMLKNSFSVNRRRIKQKRNDDELNDTQENINRYSNVNNSMVEKAHIQIISDKSDNILDDRNNDKISNTTINKKKYKNFVNNNNTMIDNKKDIEIISQIKVKRKNKFFIGEKKTNILPSNNNNNVLEKKLRKEKTFLKEKNIIILKDNSKNIKDNKIERLLTLSKLINNKPKKVTQRFNLKNINNYYSKDNTYKPYETTREKERVIENIKNSIILNNNNKNKRKEIIDKKAKEIFLTKSFGKRLKFFNKMKNKD